MGSTRLFVGNLPDSISDPDLVTAFSQYGKIVNVDLKNKPGDNKKFAFVTISASNYEVEACIRRFSTEDFNGSKLYVTRARESFLERLQRERTETKQKNEEKHISKDLPKSNPVIKLGDTLNPRKRKVEDTDDHSNKSFKNFDQRQSYNDSYGSHNDTYVDKTDLRTNSSSNDLYSGKADRKNKNYQKHNASNNSWNDSYDEKTERNSNSYQTHNTSNNKHYNEPVPESTDNKPLTKSDKQKKDSDIKRVESLKQKRQEFKQKQNFIKIGLKSIDKASNKKIIFSDNEENTTVVDNTNSNNTLVKKKNTLFEGEDDESDNEVNFKIKKQFEGVKGQKVLDLQSRYKSDNRFVLDERFIEDDQNVEGTIENDDQVDLGDADEKTKQLNILQNVLGVSIKTKSSIPDSQKTKSKFGMLRFDPTQPQHAKFLAPAATIVDTKKSKKKRKDIHENEQKQENIEKEVETPKVEVSKEQFYKVSDTLKEALEQPASFSLRSLFGQSEDTEKESPIQDEGFIPLVKKSSKVKNPLDQASKNPFVYDSSESEAEDDDKVEKEKLEDTTEVKAVWKENLFFSKLDNRLKEGLAFFNKIGVNDVQKERRELKSVMKKRLYNKERKNQMFQKKIGGRKKSMKKNYRKH